MLRPWVGLILLSATAVGCLGGQEDAPSVPAADGAPTCMLTAWDALCMGDAGPNDSPSQTEIDIGINPADPLNAFVASKDMDPLASDGCVWSIGQVTYDGGKTWSTTYVGGTLEERSDPTHPAYGWQCVTDPILIYDNDGNLYYPLQIYMNGEGDNTCFREALGVAPNLPGCTSAYFLAVSRDGGRTFPVEDILTMTSATGAVTFHDYPRMIVNPVSGTVTTAWNAIPGGIYVSSTRDQGASVDPPAVLPGLFFETGFTVTSDGTVYLVATDLVNRFLAVSSDDARTFVLRPGLPATVPSDCTPDGGSEYRCGKSGVELAADTTGGERDGRLYAVWPDGREDASDVYVAGSDDAGLTWSDPVRVNQDGTDHVQWMPRIDVGPDGTVHVVYLDRAYDPGDELYDATYAWSADGGATWSQMRVSTTASDGDLGIHQAGGPFIGDYIGIDVAADRVMMGFPTTQTGRAEVAVATVVLGP